MAQAATAARLDGPDLTYWFVDRALGWSVVLQLVWVFPHRLDPALVDDVAVRLHHGGLHRRVASPSVPGARPRWVPSTSSIPAVHDETVAADAVEQWARDELYAVDLDAGAGRCWRLRAAPLADGGHALSLCTLHLVTDGQGFVRAAAAALSAARGDAAEPVSTPARAARRRVPADGLDALRQVVLGAVGVARVLGGGLVRRGASTPDPRVPRAPLAQRSPEARVRWAVVSVPSDEWAAAARRHDGTENTLFVAVIAGALRRSGALPPGEPMKVGIPVSRRTDGDDRANATAGVSVYLDDVEGRDLAQVRARCRAAYEALDGGRRDPTVHLTPLVTVVPPTLAVRAVTAGDGMPDVMTSNIGSWGDDLLRLGSTTARGVAFRGDAQDVVPHLPYRFGDGLQSWVLQAGGRTTLSVAAFDESAFPDADVLRRVLDEELTSWGLPHRLW
ncbi:hypothetical protein [uncultured Williamsia sp.]|uniref:hypothetical protein n=1 Tax=uncultured Williamsia sp. TaxID=259311 RepID=UPI002637DC31|nr:hypothetical protein [uncultured Williamsia sp.]